FVKVDKMASLYNIHVRTGCFCNTGACQMYLGISNEDIQRNLQAGHVCGDDIDLVDGRPTGSVRISFGYMSSFEDAQTFLKFIIATRLSKSNTAIPFQSSVSNLTTEPVPDDHPSFNNGDKLSPIPHISDRELGNNSFATKATVNWQPLEAEAESIRAAVSETPVPTCRRGGKPITVTNIYLYPIKSCSAFEVTEWPVGNQGLLYDRNWMVVNQNGVCMTQKQEPRLCLVNPSIDLKQKIMVIQAEGMHPISVSLEENTGKEAVICESKVCSHRVKTYDCGERIAGWFSMFLGRPCRLIRQSSDMKNKSHQKNTKGLASATNISLSFVNEAQYLLINVASILQLKEYISARLEEPLELEELIQRFRANIVISAPESFEEEEWAEISIGALRFQVVGPCSRCQIICIDQQSAERNKEFLQSLSAARGRKTNFGIYLMNQPLHSSFPDMLSVGSQVLPVLKENTEIQSPTSSEE
ncbi:Molybdenum cofactor sulfurase, partial [Cariama cristata]